MRECTRVCAELTVAVGVTATAQISGGAAEQTRALVDVGGREQLVVAVVCQRVLGLGADALLQTLVGFLKHKVRKCKYSIRRNRGMDISKNAHKFDQAHTIISRSSHSTHARKCIPQS